MKFTDYRIRMMTFVIDGKCYAISFKVYLNRIEMLRMWELKNNMSVKSFDFKQKNQADRALKSVLISLKYDLIEVKRIFLRKFGFRRKSK